MGFPGSLGVKNLPVSAGGSRDTGSVPWSGRSPGEGHGNPLQYSCLENSTDRGVWQATVHAVAKRVRHDWVTNTHTQNKQSQVLLSHTLVLLLHQLQELNIKLSESSSFRLSQKAKHPFPSPWWLGRVGLAGDRRGDPWHTNNSLRKLLPYTLQRFLSTHVDIQNPDTNPGFKGSEVYVIQLEMCLYQKRKKNIYIYTYTHTHTHTHTQLWIQT